MYTTRLSLMRRVRNARDEIAWQEFYDIYKSLIYRYARRRDLTSADADEIVSQCFENLARVMADFDYRPTRGKFRSWLKTLVNNKITNLQDKRRREGLLPNSRLDREHDATQNELWDQTWKYEVLRSCLQQARAEVSSAHYQTFQLSAIEGWAADKIAKTLGMTLDQVYRAKHKVLRADSIAALSVKSTPKLSKSWARPRLPAGHVQARPGCAAFGSAERISWIPAPEAGTRWFLPLQCDHSSKYRVILSRTARKTLCLAR